MVETGKLFNTSTRSVRATLRTPYKRLKKLNYSKGNLINYVSLLFFDLLLFSGLVGGIDSLKKYFEGDDLVSSTLQKFSWALSELQTYLTVSENWMLHCSSNSPLKEL